MRWLQSALLVLLSLMVLGACSSASDDELQQWLAQQKNQIRPKVAAIPEQRQFKPENYNQATGIDPFSSEKLTVALKKAGAQVSVNGRLLAPELARRKEPLENFPLDAMTLVGSMVRAGQPVALVTVGKLLYQVRPGEHLGQNYGRVTKITETAVTLREIVQDATGQWTERMTSLSLQERSK